jgi:hypothetical protein
MVTREDIEHYLIQLGLPYEAAGEHTWVIHDAANIVVRYEPPLVIFRAKLMAIPQQKREPFFKLLLELNATQMIHGAYGLEADNVVLIDTLQSENLDYNEFRAALDAMLLAITQDYQKLKPFREG